MKREDLDGIDLQIPELAKGTVLPYGVISQEMKDAKEKRLRKEQWRHDWAIAIFGAFAGAFLSRPIWDGIGWITFVISKLMQQ